MPHYKCDICKFSSKIKQHFERHKNTKKHRNNLLTHQNETEEIGVIIQNNQKIIQNNPLN